MKTIFITISMLLLPFLASADPVEVDGLNYLLNEEEKTATVTSSNYNGILEIPDIIKVGEDDYTVIAIEGSAFIRNYSLLSVTIPNTIKSIGDHAFWDCTSLSIVKIGDGVETIGSYTFNNCKLISITIGKNVKTIKDNAFSQCHSLNQVYISDLAAWCHIVFGDVTSNPLYFSHHLYLNKKEVKDLVIPDGITEINDCAFTGGSNITSIVMNNGITKIGNNAFSYCTSLTNVSFPESLISIGSYAFLECTNIEELEIPNGVTTINEYTFSNCSKMERIKLPESLQIIKYSAFSGCSGLRNVTIPDNVEIIQSDAFRWSADESVDIFMNPEYPPIAYEGTFNSNSKLYVPDGSIEPYQNVVPWKNYELHTFSGSGPEKCAPPVITYKNETLSFTSATPDAVFHYVITSADGQKNIGSNLNVSGKLLVNVYASKSGYEDSETVESEIDIRGIKGDLNGDGIVNVADHVKLSDIIMNKNQ